MRRHWIVGVLVFFLAIGLLARASEVRFRPRDQLRRPMSVDSLVAALKTSDSVARVDSGIVRLDTICVASQPDAIDPYGRIHSCDSVVVAPLQFDEKWHRSPTNWTATFIMLIVGIGVAAAAGLAVAWKTQGKR